MPSTVTRIGVHFKGVPIHGLFTTKEEIEQWGEEDAYLFLKVAESGESNAQCCGGGGNYTTIDPETVVYVESDSTGL